MASLTGDAAQADAAGDACADADAASGLAPGAGASSAALDRCSRLVVKIGSALLVDAATGKLRREWLKGVAADLAAIRARGAEVMVVSSGSIALGRRVLGFRRGALALEQAQAAAAVGQIRLAQAYAEVLEPHGITAGQVLLTLDDTRERRRYLNGRATLRQLLGLGVLPVVNENDTVATDEIKFGDNDRLAARVALMAGADLLVLLSDVDGLYTADPRRDPQATRFEVVDRINPSIEAMGAGVGSDAGSGGMRTKLLAAKTATRGGCAMIICKGEVDRPLTALAEGAPATLFSAEVSPLNARKQWIAGMKPMGRLVVDAGAAGALRRGKSLLPAGLRGIEGAFERGDPVAIVTLDGASVGAALAGYGDAEARAVAGLHSREVEAALGHPGRAEVAHSDNIVIWDAETAGAGAAQTEETE
ncbi:glutamate 5-kinase [Albimonas pacifica]|uniref:Glutamate 5-kinase n=1 Tax=Albimonas pacifica TaxID=1114924 RepID=A0A1I3PB07_9RHOB|nr:glutamate 5-kinase [Albimonas pacifica]